MSNNTTVLILNRVKFTNTKNGEIPIFLNKLFYTFFRGSQKQIKRVPPHTWTEDYLSRDEL